MLLLLKIKTYIALLTVSLAIVYAAAIPAVFAQDIERGACGGTEFKLSNSNCPDGSAQESRLSGVIKNFVNILSIIVGIVAVIMVIIGGFKYITSGGDSGSITSAKHTIIYAIVGLIIVALAQTIVRFVLSKS
jgi:hypothetical protein